MILLNFILFVQVVLYVLLGTALYLPGKLYEINASYFYNLTHKDSPKVLASSVVPVVQLTSSGPPTNCTTLNCGTCSAITSSGGVISSPDFPADYGNGRGCYYTIQVPVGKKIKLTFTTFVVEEPADTVFVLDGVLPSIALISLVTGYSIPSPVTSLTNNMTVAFGTNGDNANIPAGQVASWQATYTVV